jgi:hypothetical protein
VASVRLSISVSIARSSESVGVNISASGTVPVTLVTNKTMDMIKKMESLMVSG